MASLQWFLLLTDGFSIYLDDGLFRKKIVRNFLYYIYIISWHTSLRNFTAALAVQPFSKWLLDKNCLVKILLLVPLADLLTFHLQSVVGIFILQSFQNSLLWKRTLDCFWKVIKLLPYHIAYQHIYLNLCQNVNMKMSL